MTRNKVVITGAEGYIGSNLKSHFEKNGYEVYSLTLVDSKKERYYQVNITEKDRVMEVLEKINPDVVIHTAGISSLNQCEKDKDLAWKVNVAGTRNIIEAIKKVNPSIKLIFMSSDYVFDGEKGDYKEDDETKPKTYYGVNKLESEKDIKKELENFIICRTANVYGRGGNFFNFLHDSLIQEKSVDVYDNVFYTPTFIDYLTDSVLKLVESDFKGIIHVAGREKISRYFFALVMADVLNKPKELVTDSKQPEDGLISKDSSLNTDLIKKTLNNFCPETKKSLQYCFNNLISPYFYFKDDRGEIRGLIQDMDFEEINYVESEKGAVRGNHYHKETKEAFFIISGKIRIELTDVETREKKIFMAEDKDFFIIKPNTMHTFYVLEDSKWLNMLSKSMRGENKDFYR